MAEEKDDLTRLEDLSEYLHEPDPEAEKILSEDSEGQDSNESDEPLEDFPPEFSSSPLEEDPPEESFGEEEFSSDENFSEDKFSSGENFSEDEFSSDENFSENEESNEDNWHVEETSDNAFETPPSDSDLSLGEDTGLPSTDFDSGSFDLGTQDQEFEQTESPEFTPPPETNLESESKVESEQGH